LSATRTEADVIVVAVSTIDVAVVAYNRYDLTESCLRHLAAQTREHRLIVCDNGSTDRAGERVAAEWPEATLLRMETNRGFAEACNATVAAGHGDYVVLLNNDVDCRPDFVERVVAPLEADPGIGSVAALCIRPDGERIDSIGLTMDATLSPFPRLQGRPVAEAGAPSPVLVGPAGTAAAYRRSAWEEVGGLDERIFAYGEDFDLAVRLRAAGWGAVAAPDAAGIHLGSATHGHRTQRQRLNGGFGRAYLLRRYGILRGRHALRAGFTEALVVAGDAVISRDLAALRGRWAGWRAARGLPRRPLPPEAAFDAGITLRDAIDLRRGVYRTS
jgi:N-acetylglucosaminyl-diphospho-decaprenol L-rhamnosyltransferase